MSENIQMFHMVIIGGIEIALISACIWCLRHNHPGAAFGFGFLIFILGTAELAVK
jgi:hypothetical protein